MTKGRQSVAHGIHPFEGDNQNIYCGQAVIREVLAMAPSTAHNLNRKDMLVDAFMLGEIPNYPNAVHLNLHGDLTSGKWQFCVYMKIWHKFILEQRHSASENILL